MAPNIIHFIFGLEKDFGNKPFSIIHYLAIKSAKVINNPDNIFFYYKYLPNGYWWDRIIKENMVNLVKIDVPNSIFGNKLYHYAHKSDVLRLLILIEYGGNYLDIDTICIKALKPFYFNSCNLAAEVNSGINYGLCNAVIIAEKDSLFLKYWLSTYKYFRSKGQDCYWGEHSIIIPYKISKMFPKLIRVLPSWYFFYPSYSDKDLISLFKYKVPITNSFIIHLWENLSYEKYLRFLDEDEIKKIDTTYNLVVRQYL
ncbi:hypothetical protein GCM10027566_21880 [Arachidicoccus ginsenosidivorans]|uniref:Glycosyl transferase n=1 Tax=Arachidicoccus ginsenosidivorans TaxID=496057 RepID=A0A5B8VKZ4_9BACT|nr:glycosyltransferase [Arachidicoccus ginsenosidivorans]QEC72180.1 hypothetical protein FSB73_11355 [Arachidicoccus ginsenosidivorans]